MALVAIGLLGMTGPVLADDAYEPNDSIAQAYDLRAHPRTWLSDLHGYGVKLNDDYYKIYAPEDYTQIIVDCRFTHVDGDIDVQLLNAEGNGVGAASSTSDNELLDIVVPQAGIYYIRLYYSSSGSTYNLWYDAIIRDDRYEQNDTLETAYDFRAHPQTWLNTIAGMGYKWDDDWYRINTTAIKQRVTVDCRFLHSEGDVDMQLCDAQGNVLIGSTSTSDNETLSIILQEPGDYYIRLYYTASGTPYDLWWNAQPSDDHYEWNDDREHAFDLRNHEATWLRDVAGVGIHWDDDWYRINATAPKDRIIVDCRFLDAEGDIDVALFNAAGDQVANSASRSNQELIDIIVQEPGDYYVRVYYGSRGNTYDLWWSSTPSDDHYEINDDLDHAYDLSNHRGTWLHDIDGPGIKYDDDWYKIVLPTGPTTLTVDCRFTDADGDIDMALFNASGAQLAGSGSRDNREYISYNAPAGTYYVRLYYANRGNAYDLWWSTGDATPATPPTGVVAVSGAGPGQIDLSWDPVPGATGYRVWYGEAGNSQPWSPNADGVPVSGADVGNVTSQTISGLTSATEYLLAVSAYNDLGNGPFSATVRAEATVGALTDDLYEENDTLLFAYDLSVNADTWLSVLHGHATQADDDWYKISVPADRTQVSVECHFLQNEGDVDIALYDSVGSGLAWAESHTNNELLVVDVPDPGTYYIRVYGQNIGSPYDLWWNTGEVTVPPAPEGVAAQGGPAVGQIALSWDAAPGATGYHIWYDDGAVPPWDPTVNGVPANGADVGNVTQVLVNDLGPGTTYTLGVTAYNRLGGSAMSTTVTATATAAPPDLFDANSATITNPWLGLTNVGDSYELLGTGTFTGATRTYSLTGTDTVLGVDCLNLRIFGHGNNPVIEWYDARIAQDVDGNIRVLKVTGADDDGDPVSWDAATPVESWVLVPSSNANVGEVFDWAAGGEHRQVMGLDETVGSYTGCRQMKWWDDGGDTDYSWWCPNVGVVKETWDEDGQANGWLRSAPTGDDAYEPNNERAQAWDFSAHPETWLSTIDGQGIQADNDWYKIAAPTGATQIVVDLRFTHGDGDIDVALYDADGSELGSSTTTSDNEYVETTISSPGDYYILVYYDNAGNAYDLWWSAGTAGLAAPEGVMAGPGGRTGQIILSWNAVVGATGYRVWYGEPGNDPPWEPTQNGTPASGADVGTVTQQFISGLTPGQEYNLSVTAYNGEGPSPHSAVVSATATGQASTDDAYEPNNERIAAYDLSGHPGVWLHNIDGYGIQADADWYKITVPTGSERVTVDCTFTTADGDIDVGLYDADGNSLAYSSGTSDNESIDIVVPAAGIHYIQVYYGNQGNQYDLMWNALPPGGGAQVDYTFVGGWNAVGVALMGTEVPATAADLAAWAPECTAVAGWDRLSQSWQTYVPGVGGNSFDIWPGHGYMVQCAAGSRSIQGQWAQTMWTGGTPGHAFKARSNDDDWATSASSILNWLGTPGEGVWKWNAADQRWNGWAAGFGGTDFVVQPGDAVMIATDGDVGP